MTGTDPAQDWLDAFTGPLIVLMNVFVVVGILGIVASLWLILARSPKHPPKRGARR